MNQELSAALKGYERAAAFIEQERMERLQQMSSEEARAIFNELMAGWSGPETEGDLHRLQEWRLATSVKVRKTFLKLARSKGLV